MPDLVRVRDALTGHHYTTARSKVVADPSRFRVLKSPALDRDGQPLPPKFAVLRKTPTAPAAEQAAQATTTEANEEATK